MWMSGLPDGPPVAIDFPLISNIRALCDGIARVSSMIGQRVELDAGRILVQRAAERGLERQGQISANRSCRIIRCPDGWMACSLPRPGDVHLVPAVIRDTDVGEPWVALRRLGRHLPAAEIVERLQLVGIAAAALPALMAPTTPGPRRAAVDFVRIGESSAARSGAGPLVVDFSALWAGPLCTHILGLCGARIVKVEDPARLDGARQGDHLMYARLHNDHDVASISLSTNEGRSELHRLLDQADVVVEASRPRALAQLGVSPEGFVSERSGRSWISITGYGRSGPRSNYAAYGDDAAASAGLIAWSDPDTPVFCADAIADPITGLFAAFAGLVSISAGGGFLLDVSMSAASAAMRNGPSCDFPHLIEKDSAGHWVARHYQQTQRVLSPAESLDASIV